MKVIKRILTIVITIILVTIFTYNVYNIINIKVLKKDTTPVFGYSMLEVVSGSMEPTIHVGDMIIIDLLGNNFQENDIVTFKDENGALVTHRIISLNGNEMITKGDNNDSEDPVNTTDTIIGKYVTRISGLGRILAAFKSPLTMGLILFIGVLTCILVSTDKEGNPIVEEEDKEFLEYLENKKNNKLDNNVEKTKSEKNNPQKSVEKEKSKKVDSKKKNTTKETTAKKSTNNKKDNSKKVYVKDKKSNTKKTSTKNNKKK